MFKINGHNARYHFSARKFTFLDPMNARRNRHFEVERLETAAIKKAHKIWSPERDNVQECCTGKGRIIGTKFKLRFKARLSEWRKNFLTHSPIDRGLFLNSWIHILPVFFSFAHLFYNEIYTNLWYMMCTGVRLACKTDLFFGLFNILYDVWMCM